MNTTTAEECYGLDEAKELFRLNRASLAFAIQTNQIRGFWDRGRFVYSREQLERFSLITGSGPLVRHDLAVDSRSLDAGAHAACWAAAYERGQAARRRIHAFEEETRLLPTTVRPGSEVAEHIDSDRFNRARTAVHEAAHAVVARAVGFADVTAEMTPGHPRHNGLANFRVKGLTASIERYCDIAVTLAGPLAAELMLNKEHPTTEERRGFVQNLVDDVSLLDLADNDQLSRDAVRIVQTAQQGTFTADIPAGAEPGFVRAIALEVSGDTWKLIARRWNEIMDVADKLLRDGTVTLTP